MPFMHIWEIEAWLNKIGIEDYTISNNGVVDVEGSVDLDGKLAELEVLPFRFGSISSSFCCRKNKLASLFNAPFFVGGEFNCSSNRLNSLIGAPNKVVGKFDCSANPLTSLKGFPELILDGFVCSTSEIDDFLGTDLPEHVKRYVTSEWWEKHTQLIRQRNSLIEEMPDRGIEFVGSLNDESTPINEF